VQVKGSLFIVMVVQVAVVVSLMQVVAAVHCALRRNRCIACQTRRQAIQYSLFSFSW
jgi:hypothetical protein